VPLSAVMIGDRVAEALIDCGDFSHGFTYSGHPVSCAVALENIRILREEKIVERVHNDTGPYLAKRLAELNDHPLVGETRLRGFMGAIELVKDKKSRKTFEPLGDVGTICRDHCFNIGLVMRATRDTMLISPPLSWLKGEIDAFIDLTRKALDLTLADVKRRF
ncbi:MAG TPA: aminotransferase class III-fold pyridoxal phosphate-dependent enzyme, partial [Candidatus Polarisedimenticolia bacterium]|nr:aminotransferase class III-fold pyridoxal phosphate-dependent enzyme [Candidatus Polarisedimenticolia bacterium]